MKPVDHGIFQYHAASFPAELRSSNSSTAAALRRPIEQAGGVLAEFDTLRESTMADKRLSPTGKREALKRWVDDNLPQLRTDLEEAAKRAGESEESVIASILRGVIDKPTEPADAMLASEIRSYLRNIESDLARSDALRRLAGDRTVLRSVLTAPAFLSGVKDADIMQLRLAAARDADPERYGKTETLRAGWASAEKAAAAVARAIEQALADTSASATGDRNLPAPDPVNTARVTEALRRAGHDPVVVDPETNRERVAAALRRPENAAKLGLAEEDEAA